jgi:choice-of-anchor I-like protein/phytase-like protein
VLQVLDRHETGSFNHSAAEIVDYHPSSHRVFVVDAAAGRVCVLVLGALGFERSERTLEPRRDIPGFNAGSVTSLAVEGDLLAVAVGGASNAKRGRVAFYSPTELRYLGSVPVGYAPDMLTFTPDGGKVLVANEGEQVRDPSERIVTDPEGSVSIIDVSRGVEQAAVTHATFAAFDSRIEEYRSAGVRMPRLGDRFFASGNGKVQLSRDLEPEYIGVAADGKTAWVSLQENDAVGVLDIEAGRFTDILPLGSKDFSLGAASLETLALSEDATTTWAGLSGGAPDVVPGAEPPTWASASGLWYEADESGGARQVFYVLRAGAIERHVLAPGQLYRSRSTALPKAAAIGSTRGLARDRRDGSFWLGSARRPLVYQLHEDGRLARAVDLASAVGDGAGVDALAFDVERGRLFAFIQARASAAAHGTALVRIVAIDANAHGSRFGASLAEYLLPLEGGADGSPPQVGAAAIDRSGQLLVVVRSAAGAGSTESVLGVDLTGASDVLGREPRSDGAGFMGLSVDELVSSYRIVLAHQRRLFTLPREPGASGLDVVGAARLLDGRIALLGLRQAPSPRPNDPRVGERGRVQRGPVLGIVSFDDGNRLDASDRDGAVRVRHWPVLGSYMPDGLHALRVKGEDYFLTANEGDTRHYDAKRLADVDLDPSRFGAAASLQSRASLGRLKISALDGDLDGDGDLDEIHAFGARSLSVWSAAGELVFDTGSLFEDVTAVALANEFNSNNDENMSFDTRSDDRGPEPEGLELAEISGRAYAFVGLERVGGIVVLDVSDPRAPVFVEYVNPRDFSGSADRGGARDLGPEGLKFVPAGVSPTGRDLLLVGNEVSGTTTAYEVNL